MPRVAAKTEYACVAMFELARRFDADEPVRIRAIAEQHHVPSRFLVQILLQLKGAGLVASTRGASGGYQLARPPDEITLAEVMSVMEGSSEAAASTSLAPSPAARVFATAWRQAHAAEQQVLGSITFADLLERARQQNETMYYI